MTQSDVYYRAFAELKKALEENRALLSFEGAIAGAAEPDKIVVTHNVCHVEEDWVAAIERGLVFIGRAIEEDRQFIRSNGEIQPIEKVRHISRESVLHLSRHSDLINREQQTDDLIPEKLYTVERLNDYAVYENRFLYLLLLRIKDFVSYRYDEIMRAYRLYRGELVSRKQVSTATRRFKFDLTFTDEQDDVFSAAADTQCAQYLDRLEKIQQSVAFYLRTPLMVEVARVDKIKSKITKTNVLRMDKNFREAVTLYEFLLSYERDGYTVEREIKGLDPVPADVERELALPMLLASFLVYEHGLGMEEYLREEFAKEEARRAEQAQLVLMERIKALKKRVELSGEGLEEYALLLEERNAALEKDRERLIEARAEIDALHGKIGRMEAEAEELRGEIGQLNEANEKLAEEMRRAEEAHREQVERMRRERAEAEAEMRAKHAEELAQMQAKHAEALRLSEEKRREEAARIRSDCEARVRAEKEKLAEKERELRGVEETLRSARGDLSGAERECEVLRARITALRSEKGQLTPADDFTTEEGFNALEHEFEVLGRLVRDRWTDVKKILRKEFYEGIRADMRSKRNAKKSAEYDKLCEEVGARREKKGEAAAFIESEEALTAPDGQTDSDGKEGE